jgi:formylglycine-generating enzyme required for sulfatase activity
MKKWHKTTLVVLGAIVFSTVAIQASDVLRNINGGLSGLVIESQGVCGLGSVQVMLGSGSLCVDQYEASAGEECPVASPSTPIDTQGNMNEVGCVATSKQDMAPWRFVSLSQAQQLCARTGKRLPNADEWHALASSLTSQSGCIVAGNGPSTTGNEECVSQAGIYDLVGNVWEWIDADVYDGRYNERPLPESGYVQMVDSDGIVVETSNVGSEEYGDDYATTNLSGVRGILRGGFYRSGDDAGLYSQNISVPLDFKAPGVGFRCVKSI